MLEILVCLVCYTGSDFKMLKGFAGISELAKFEDENFVLQTSGFGLFDLCNETPSDTNIDSYVSMKEICSITQRPKCDIVGAFERLKFAFNGVEMELSSCFQFLGNNIVGGNLTLLDSKTSECHMTFPIEKWPYFRIKKLMTAANVEFIFVQSGKNSVSDNVCIGLWIIGKFNDEIVTFINLETLKRIGLVYQDITSSIECGAIKLLGCARDRDCRVWSQNRNEIMGYQYQGHKAYELSSGNCGINAVYITRNNMSGILNIRLKDDLNG